MDPEAKAPGKAGGYADGVPEGSRMESSTTSKSSVSNQVHPGMYDGQEIPWPLVERKIHKLQRRIYRASPRARQQPFCPRTVMMTYRRQASLSRREVSVTRRVSLRSRMR